MIDFLFVYEHKVRELDNLCLLKAALELKGYTVDLVQVHQLNLIKYRFWRKPRVVIPFCMYNDETYERLVIDIVGATKKVVNMRWEQALSKNDIKSGFHIPTGKAADVLHLCWGKDGYNLFSENGIKNLAVVGAMQMDFLHGKLKNIYLDRQSIDEKYHLPKGKAILYISTFVYASMTPEEQVRFEKNIGASVAEKIVQNKKVRTATLEWLNRFLDENEEYFVVYRPHPGENIDDELKEMAKKNKRFVILFEESVKQWIVVSDKIVTYYSSSVSEVYYADKECIILRPYPLDSAADVMFFENAEFTTTYEEMSKKLTTRDNKFPIMKEKLVDCYGEVGGPYSYEKIVALLEEVLKTHKYDMSSSTGRFNFKGPIRRLIKKLVISSKISSKTVGVKKIPKLCSKLDFLYYSENKFKEDFATPKYIEDKTETCKKIILMD